MPPIDVQTSAQTKKFYNDLVSGTVNRGLWGKKKRFEASAIAAKPSVKRHFIDVSSRYLTKNDVVLDLGCGPGGFLLALAPMCARIVGADITPAFVELCKSTIAQHQLENATVDQIEPGQLPYGDASFDKIFMIDTIHHLEDSQSTMREVTRVLKPGGILLVFEPNKGNPLLAVMCLLDRNEHGLLRLGTFRAYERILAEAYDIVERHYNGLLIGPDSGLSVAIADAVSEGFLSKFMGWFSPKLFIAARKK
ncbi:MAG: class I SAM-dependent methyltransferase [Rhodospirillum sp.]|nr:class I SAM-dependent methyltransferase [Rhodospirillum sp.]MCF8489098.1 class I SAM-dependent methyltransferase [Rhodospirillum sp.]MCF8498888.1 class I SAM-dependent methyltransferase [Rhodospirillum sp.]